MSLLSFQNTDMLEKCLQTFDQGFEIMFFQGTDAEVGWKYQPIGRNSARLEFVGPMPALSVQSIAENFCQRVQKNAVVRIDDLQSVTGTATTLLVSWSL